MFEIEYNFFDDDPSSIAEADATAFRYSLFLGSVRLSTTEASIELDWGWIPILDFALSLLAISKSLSDKMKSEETFDFTESDDTLIFKKDGCAAKISASFSDIILYVDLQTFHETVKRFYRDVVFKASNRNKELKENRIFLGYLKDAESI